MTRTSVRAGPTWWGEFPLEEGQMGRWRVGPLELWVRRSELDWAYGTSRGDDPAEDALEVEVPWSPDGGERPEEAGRFGAARTGPGIALAPALADRPVVARPAVPFFVLPGEKVEVFVSTPLWIRLSAGANQLAEVPCVRPSDTWVGGNTGGELCYATRTRPRRQLQDVELRPQRAVSCVSIENASHERLALQRLSLPVPQLSLFASPAGQLWTELVSVRNDEDGELSEVSLGKGPPRLAGEGALVAGPRSPQGRSFGSLIFGGLFEAGT